MKKLLLSFILPLIISLFAKAQDITFRSLTTDNGLSQISVNAMYQDERGGIWIGTREGINCYNGNEIKTYKLQKDNPNSLFSNNIIGVSGDQNGKVYLLCTEGISELDLEKEKFTTILYDASMKAILYNKQLYIGKDNEVYKYDEKSKKIKLFYSLPQKNDLVSCIYIDSKDHIWIGTSNNGLYKLETKGSQFSLQHIVTKANIASIYEDSENEIWVGSWDQGLFRFAGEAITKYTNKQNDANSISADFVRTCCEDNLGNIWIGTFKGLDKFNKKTEQFSHYTANGTSGGMTHSSVWNIIKDHQGTIWVGTYFGGVNYFNPEYEIYTHYKASDNEKDGLSSPIVGKMVEDKHNNLWICTEGGGLNVYNRKNKTFRWYKPDHTKNSISQDNIKAIYYDSDHDIMWIGTHLGGLNRLDLKTNIFTHYYSVSNDSSTLPSNIVRDIVPYKNDLLIATQNGVCLFSPQTGKSKQLFKDTQEGLAIKMVADLFIDYYGTLWIAATGEGVFSYRFDTNKLTNYRYETSHPNSISNNNINNITQDHNYNLWFSTSGSGLDLYRYDTDDFVNFDSQKNGLSSDCIYEVCESRFGKLLLITNQGFSEFDYANNIFHNYSIDNGFPLSAINENALYLTQDDEIFLGGVQGMVSFHEEDLKFQNKGYQIIPSRLTVNGKEVQIGDQTKILQTSLYDNPNITLKNEYSVFSIEFATTNYIPANKGEIEYKLDGFSDDWTNANGQHIVTYTNLNPGTYTLIIKGSIANGTDVAETKLNITILPPFYKTIYAYIIYALLLAAILFYILRFYKSKIELQESLRYEKKQIQDVEILNQSKLRFFTNISHEFRTPLTLIIGQMEMLIQRQSFTPQIYNKLLTIYKNSLQMRTLISELLDFRKQEQGHMTIKVSCENIVDFLNENYLLFVEYANAKEINLIFKKEIEYLEVWYDAKQIQKVINNLLSNAFKHVKSHDTITISLREDKQNAIIEIEDTGTGIAFEDLNKIFDRFYQTESLSSATGTGIGLALTKGIIDLHYGTISVSSEIGKGTIFKVSLPLGKEHFTPSQIDNTVRIEKEYQKEINHYLELSVQLEASEDDVDLRNRDTKMLIVEDNQLLRDMLIRIFESFYTIVAASNGQEGLQMAKQEMPDIVLSDVLMPHMSGIELCKAIKTDLEICHIPVVLLTARTALEHNLEGLQNGADDYITKPFNVSILVSRCNNLVNSRIVLKEKFGKQPQITPKMLATNKLDKDFLDNAMDVIEKNITNANFNIDILATEMGIARTNIYAKIKAITGQTPNKFILTIKLKRAAYMLKNNPELNVSDISDLTGFNSPRYFSKCFKETYHINPLYYRSGEEQDFEEEQI